MTSRRKSAACEKQIPERAREVYIERGGFAGRALGYWLQAEIELKRFAANTASLTKKDRCA